ncbi:MAG: 9-O-acetylesterase, partial [Treponema sp.]|nr:9-O-acetylesterase [Treponema sp.]
MIILSPLFSDNMVIQHGIPFPVWGKAASGVEVSVTLGKASASACADATGAWRLSLPPVPAGGPYTMEISADGEKITLNRVFSGDVWLAAGQSNMELPMQRLKDDYAEEWKNLASQSLPPIHHFKVPQECDFSGPRQEISGGCWTPASDE